MRSATRRFPQGLGPTRSTTLEYMTKETIQVNVTFQQMGVDPSPVTADAKLEIWHPIGVIIQEWTFNITQQLDSQQVPFIWTPTAHSTLSDDGFLSGGVTSAVLSTPELVSTETERSSGQGCAHCFLV